ncbi:MAG: allantoicase [Sedimenticolaceae bacterium]|jgi:allantoicase
MAPTDNPFRQLTNLADSRLGAKAVFTTDDWFGPGERLLEPHDPVFYPGRFDERGQWMDGWETRRRRTSGNDYAIIRLGYPGTLAGIDIDTSHFTGNYPPAASIEACYCPNGDPDDSTIWVSLLHSVDITADSHHYLSVADKGLYSHVRLNIYPDGGVARLRVYGTPTCDWQTLRESSERIDLFALRYGGRAITCNDEHYGSIKNLNLPGRGLNMGDGWETRRRREPGNDWALLALGHAGIVKSIEVDTAYFKGNYPDACSIQAAYVRGGTESSLVTQSMFWDELLPKQRLRADQNHCFEDEVREIGPITHIRLNIIPDGGISRLRIFGHVEQ